MAEFAGSFAERASSNDLIKKRMKWTTGHRIPTICKFPVTFFWLADRLFQPNPRGWDPGDNL